MRITITQENSWSVQFPGLPGLSSLPGPSRLPGLPGLSGKAIVLAMRVSEWTIYYLFIYLLTIYDLIARSAGPLASALADAYGALHRETRHWDRNLDGAAFLDPPSPR